MNNVQILTKTFSFALCEIGTNRNKILIIISTYNTYFYLYIMLK